MDSLGIEREAKALLPNSATSTHIFMSNSVVQSIAECRTQFFHVKYITVKHKRLNFIYNS